MLGPYTANEDKTISYKGNKVFLPIKNVLHTKPKLNEVEGRVTQFHKKQMWKHISKINHRINIVSNTYFDSLGALFTALPMTTRMISSPGAVYGKEAINHTTDTCPITLDWFDLPKKAFLSESSQIYLELALLQEDVDQVYSIYNSFRKEEADETHLSEFHHIEYEGNVSQHQNELIALRLIKMIIQELLKHNREDLAFFLESGKLDELQELSKSIESVPRITFKRALQILHEETKDDKYKDFTLKHFGAWEEIKLTEILGNMVIITEYPLLEVPFYHAMIEESSPAVANNSDIIWPGYRETIGSGLRVRSEKELRDKAVIFNLPEDDYQPYMQSRTVDNYKESAGFGIGWERLLQGLLELPYIWTGTHFPRIDKTLKP